MGFCAISTAVSTSTIRAPSSYDYSAGGLVAIRGDTFLIAGGNRSWSIIHASCISRPPLEIAARRCPSGSLISTEKQCGGDLATGTHIAEDLRGQLLTGRFKSRQVVRYEFIENGAGFSANVLAPLLSSKHPNFRPVDVKTGPDGAIYVADWYNSIINHAQHDFRDPRRDHDHGRIWRITHKERPLVEKPKLDGISIAASRRSPQESRDVDTSPGAQGIE